MYGNTLTFDVCDTFRILTSPAIKHIFHSKPVGTPSTEKLKPLKRSFVIALFFYGLFTPAIRSQETTLPDDPFELSDASEDALISDREAVDLVTDSNVAEAVSRRPDLQYNNVIIDGERSNLSLSDIPADAVSEIELLRAVTPDTDADARGGSLNLSSNPTFNLEEPVLKSDAWVQFSDGENTWARGASASYSRALGDLGFRLTASHNSKHDISEGFYLNWSEQNANTPLYTPDYLIENRQEQWEKKQNLGAAFDYRFTDYLHAFARFNYAETDHEGYQPRIFLRYYEGSYEDITQGAATVTGAQVDKDLTAWESLLSQKDFLVGFIYDDDTWKFDARLLGEFRSYLEPDWFIIQFKTNPVDLEYRLNEKSFPLLTAASQDLKDSSIFVFDELLSERWGDKNDRWVASANLRYDFEAFGADAYLKTGLKWTRRVKDQTADSRIYTNYRGEFTLADIASKYHADSLLAENVNWGEFPTLADSRQYFSENFELFDYDLKRSAQKGDPATYLAEEEIASSYAMLNVSRNRWRSIIGFRVEQTSLEYEARAVLIDQNGEYLATELRTGTNSYTNFFPSFHLRYFLGNRITLIGSWTGTIERPYFGNTVPYENINYDSQSIDAGNPKLNPTLYNNFDFSIDYKLSDTSVFSIELFSKEVEDIVYWEVTEIQSGQYAGFSAGTHTNGPSATAKGIRFILNQNLHEWSKYLEHFNLLLKYSLQDSETRYPGRESESLPITYHPEHVFEANLNYQTDKWFVQLQYACKDTELASVYGASWQDVYDISNEDLSINANYNINDSLRIYCEFDARLSGYAKTYYGVPERPATQLWRSKKFEIGVKLNL